MCNYQNYTLSDLLPKKKKKILFRLLAKSLCYQVSLSLLSPTGKNEDTLITVVCLVDSLASFSFSQITDVYFKNTGSILDFSLWRYHSVSKANDEG